MLKIENTEVLGWEHAIHGMRNPMNSWANSDSSWRYVAPAQREGHILASYSDDSEFWIGPNDANLMNRLRNAGTDPVPYIRVLEGLMGLNGEAGEAIDLMKKVLFQGHEFDREHMAKELGDIAWYLAVSADAIGYDLESILQMNVDKLRTRYPDGFSTEQSLHRSANDI